MAKELKGYVAPRARAERAYETVYPYDRWFGVPAFRNKVWELSRGTDFSQQIQLASVRSALHGEARRRGVKISIHKKSSSDDDTLILHVMGPRRTA
jgi:hypothetical protein